MNLQYGVQCGNGGYFHRISFTCRIESQLCAISLSPSLPLFLNNTVLLECIKATIYTYTLGVIAPYPSHEPSRATCSDGLGVWVS